ncbi:MAG: TonB C-terminal domain-containing protein, partial [Francisellaceae bacterium]|nr:TonB C-terminal domain-containing protein [Francisellaceae bacterium]
AKEQQEQKEAQARKLKEDQELAAKMKAKQEKSAQRRVWLDAEYTKVVAQIQTSVIEKRNLISAFSDELICEVQFRLLTDGNVASVKIVKSSGNDAYDESAKIAVYKAAPFDIPKDQELLSRLKDIILVFTKDTLNV